MTQNIYPARYRLGVWRGEADTPVLYCKLIKLAMLKEDRKIMESKLIFSRNRSEQFVSEFNTHLGEVQWTLDNHFAFLGGKVFHDSGVLCQPENRWLRRLSPLNTYFFWHPWSSEKRFRLLVSQQTLDKDNAILPLSKRSFLLTTITENVSSEPSVADRPIMSAEVDRLFGTTYRQLVEINNAFGDNAQMLLSADGRHGLLSEMQLNPHASSEELGPTESDWYADTFRQMRYVEVHDGRVLNHDIRLTREGKNVPYLRPLGWINGGRYLLGQNDLDFFGDPSCGSKHYPTPVVIKEARTWREHTLFVPPPGYSLVAFQDQS